MKTIVKMRMMNCQVYSVEVRLRVVCARDLLSALSRILLPKLTKIVFAALDPEIHKMWIRRCRNRPWLHAPVSKLGSIAVRQTFAREELTRQTIGTEIDVQSKMRATHHSKMCQMLRWASGSTTER
jgi:hypothetical protein